LSFKIILIKKPQVYAFWESSNFVEFENKFYLNLNFVFKFKAVAKNSKKAFSISFVRPKPILAQEPALACFAILFLFPVTSSTPIVFLLRMPAPPPSVRTTLHHLPFPPYGFETDDFIKRPLLWATQCFPQRLAPRRTNK
jgi:hypothetical protein